MDEHLTMASYRPSYDGEALDFLNPGPYLYSEYIEYYDRETLELVDRVGTGRRFEYDREQGRLVEYFSDGESLY